MKRKSVFFLGAACFALLVVTGVGLLTGDQTVLAQARRHRAYRVAPLWPPPFPDDSWVIGSVSGVTVDSQNHVLGRASRQRLARRQREGHDSGRRPGRRAGSAVVERVLHGGAGRAGVRRRRQVRRAAGAVRARLIAWPQATGGIAVDAKGNVWIAAAGADTPPPAAGRGRGGAPPPMPAAQRGRARPRRSRRHRRLPPGDAHVLKFSRNGLPHADDRHARQDGRRRQPDHAQSSDGDRVRLGGERSVHRRQRQPPHRRVRCRQGHLQAALVRVRREGRRRRGRSVRSEAGPARSRSAT